MLDRPRGSKTLSPRIRKFLALVVDGGGAIGPAAKECGLSWSQVCDMKDTNPTFREALAEAQERGTDVLESELFRRSLAGQADPASATLLQFALRALMPEKYRENAPTTSIVVGTEVITRAKAIMEERRARGLDGADAETNTNNQQTGLPSYWSRNGSANGHAAETN